MNTRSFQVGLVQMSVGTDLDQNLARAVEKVGEAARAGAQVVCLQELFRSPYFCQKEDAALFDLAESVPGPSTEALGAAARKAGVTVIVPLFERRAPGLYHNSAAVMGPDGKMIGRIMLPERCANLCFGGVKRNRLFMAASQSVYSVYVETQGGIGG